MTEELKESEELNRAYEARIRELEENHAARNVEIGTLEIAAEQAGRIQIERMRVWRETFVASVRGGSTHDLILHHHDYALWSNDALKAFDETFGLDKVTKDKTGRALLEQAEQEATRKMKRIALELLKRTAQANHKEAFAGFERFLLGDETAGDDIQQGMRSWGL